MFFSFLVCRIKEAEHIGFRTNARNPDAVLADRAKIQIKCSIYSSFQIEALRQMRFCRAILQIDCLAMIESR